MANHLLKLRIEHLRGAITPFDLSFEKGKRLSIVYGENGTGKTTICDALELISRGKIGSLDKKGLGNTLHPYWPSHGKSLNDIKVSLETKTGNVIAEIQGSNAIVSPPNSAPKIQIFRRSQLLELLEARPADRYVAISKFVDVTKVEESEKQLKTLIDSTKSELKSAIAKINENDTAIKQYWDAAGSPEGNYLDWAKAEAAKDITKIEESASRLSAVSKCLDVVLSLPEKIDPAIHLLAERKDALSRAEADLKEMLETKSAGTDDLIAILESAKSFVEKSPQLEVCPLCQSSEKIIGLGDAINIRLEQLKLVKQSINSKNIAQISFNQANTSLENLIKEIATISKQFEDLMKNLGEEELALIPKNKVPTEFDELKSWIEENSPKFSNLKTELENLTSFKRVVISLRAALQTYADNLSIARNLEKLLPLMEEALNAIREERIKFTDTILESIATNAGELYELVHPGEGLNAISMQLDPKQRASLKIGAKFGEIEDAPPQAYFSQSHLDTLGLCIFLALAAREDAANTILVLDDVLASVDEPHVERVIEMLYEAVQKFQHCIVTTHYGPWRHKYRWGWLKNGQAQFVELSKWTLENGLRQIRFIPDIERLGALLAEEAPDNQLICSKAGVILEAILDFITLLYECKVPRKSGNRFTVGDLLPAIDSKLRGALKVEIKVGENYVSHDLEPILQKLIQISQARNIFGAHFSEISFELLDSDAVGFGEEVLKLATLVIDVENGWPRKERIGSYWATVGETKRLHPLKQPS